ncbi:hypothetical protein PoB_000131900 [Plakobranchus ocellatus]|uniref:Uncharacterized protein n=1 Tax=Plakobranchus ocellatus TaxID=259542 RepID=A0AAV3XYG6_9GAST|nr:hypothetical protein PoB_000131900 [Plakobranchus ocellatus]
MRETISRASGAAPRLLSFRRRRRSHLASSVQHKAGGMTAFLDKFRGDAVAFTELRREIWLARNRRDEDE